MTADGVEGLAVFRRAYAVSLEVHRASLIWPKVEQIDIGKVGSVLLTPDP